MKPFFISLGALVILYSESTAQGSYFSAAFGYGFPAGDRIGIESPGGIEKNVYGSYGKGLTLGLNTGYMVNSNVGFDLGIWYVIGFTNEFVTFDTTVGNVTDRVSGKTFRIMPAVNVSSEGKNKLYAKFGLVLGIATELNDDQTYSVPSSGGGSTLVSAEQEFTGGTSFGWAGAFGIDFSGNQAASIFIEVNFCHQNYSPEILTQSASGFSNTYRLVDEPHPAASDEKLKPVLPFSTIGITLGVKFSSFLKKKDAAPIPTDK